MLLVLVGIVATLIPTLTNNLQSNLPPTATTVQFTTLKCIIGSEKQPFFSDPEVVQALHDQFQLAVNFTTQGSIAMVQMPTADLKSQSIDCLSPSNNSASALFERITANPIFPATRRRMCSIHRW